MRWSELTPGEKREIAWRVEIMRAVNRCYDSAEAGRQGRTQEAYDLAGEARSILRRLAKESASGT